MSSPVSTTAVAPTRLASARRDGCKSTPTICSAPADLRGHDRGQADGAAADDHHRSAGDGARVVEDRPGAGHDPATDRREHTEWEVGVESRTTLWALTIAVRRERRLTHEVAGQRVPVDIVQRRGAVFTTTAEAERGGVLTVRGLPVDTAAAVAAEGLAHHHVRAGVHRWSPSRADRFDDPAPSCPSTAGKRHRDVAVLHGDVGVADAHRHDPHQHFVGLRFVERQPSRS